MSARYAALSVVFVIVLPRLVHDVVRVIVVVYIRPANIVLVAKARSLLFHIAAVVAAPCLDLLSALPEHVVVLGLDFVGVSSREIVHELSPLVAVHLHELRQEPLLLWRPDHVLVAAFRYNSVSRSREKPVLALSICASADVSRYGLPVYPSPASEHFCALY